MSEQEVSRPKALGMAGALLVLLSLMCAVSFGMVPFLTDFVSYAGANKSFFDVVIDVFYETILPLNGLLICLFVSYRWRKQNFNSALKEGSTAYQGSWFARYVNFSIGTFIPLVLAFIFLNTVLTKYFGLALLG